MTHRIDRHPLPRLAAVLALALAACGGGDVNSTEDPLCSGPCLPPPPPAPTVTLTLGAVTASSVALKWSDTFTNELKQELWRSSSYTLDCTGPYQPSSWQLVKSFGPSSTALAYTDAGLRDRTDYCYQVRLTRSDGTIYTSSQACTTTLPLGAITELSAQSTASSITVSWRNDFVDVSQFVLERGTGSTFWPVATVANSTFPTCQLFQYQVQGLESSVEACFQLWAVAALDGKRVLEDQRCFYTQSGIPAAPSLSLSSVTSTSATLVFTDNSNDESTNGVRRCSGGACVTSEALQGYTGSGTSFSLVESGLIPDTDYVYTAFASNWAGTRYGSDVRVHTPALPQSELMSYSLPMNVVPDSSPEAWKGTFPMGGNAVGHLDGVEMPGPPAIDVVLLKHGHLSTDCVDPSAIVNLPHGMKLTPDQMMDVFGDMRPALPVTLIACGPLGNPTSFFINLTWDPS